MRPLGSVRLPPSFEPTFFRRGRRGRDSPITEHATAAPADELRAEITDSLVAIWARYTGKHPIAARTEIRDNAVTCVVIDSVSHDDPGSIERKTQDPASGASSSASTLRAAAYKSEAAATVADLTGRSVTSLISSHDRDTNAATEIFTLERRLSS